LQGGTEEGHNRGSKNWAKSEEDRSYKIGRSRIERSNAGVRRKQIKNKEKGDRESPHYFKKIRRGTINPPTERIV